MCTLCMWEGGVDWQLQQQFWAQQLSIRRSIHTHTHTYCFLKGFRFPKKQKKRRRKEQAIPKRVLPKRSSAISRSYSTTSSYQFLLGKLWVLRDSTHYIHPPPLHLLPPLPALALPLIRNTNKPKKRRATTTTRRQTTLRAIKTV